MVTPPISTPPSSPVAIVGMACRFPGRSDTPEQYWSLLRSGRCAITETPTHRWDVDEYYDPDPRAPGKMYSRHGAFLEQRPEAFDASFFGISPHEAWPIDPSQRLLLEVAWESLENAGIPPRSLDGSSTGVFAGVADFEYATEQVRVGTVRDLTAYHALGSAAFGSGRLSYLLGLEGPSVSLDTACSSSLVATVMAVDSLQSGRCRTALAGGAHLMLTPMAAMILCRMTALSVTGRSRVFDEAADGFVRGEGAGMVVLKRLEDAVADGDRVLAVIRSGSWNHDGRSTSLATPRGEAQERAMRDALARAGLSPADIGYVEAHGTGTPVGDPIEAAAIGNVLASDRPGAGPLLLGSGKTNIGHLEAASGVAALIKVVLALQHREIPAHLNLDDPSPHIDWERYDMRVPRETTPWESSGRPRIAGINSFGLSGTNSHLIVEEAPTPSPGGDPPSETIYVLPVSGRTEWSTKELAERYGDALPSRPRELRDFCYTAGVGRSHDRRRMAVVGSTHEELGEALRARRAADVEPSPLEHAGATLAFVFTGQGGQYPGMGRGLYETSPRFRSVLDQCARELESELEHPLLSVLYDDAYSEHLSDTAYTQPAMLAVELALVDVWASLGIRPTHVMGHSLGEYAAAVVAGVMNRKDALRLVTLRGRLMTELTEPGAMGVAFAPEDEVRKVIDGVPEVSVGAINGPRNTVISGRHERIADVEASLRELGIEFQALDVSHAFHSPLMDPMLETFEEAVGTVELSAPEIAMVSNVFGAIGDPEAFTEPGYWRRHIREPVRFADSVSALEEAGVGTFVEIGPNPTLLGMVGSNLSSARGVLLPSLRKGQDDRRRLSESVARLFETGFDVNWAGLDANEEARRTSVPTYPFDRRPHWYEADSGSPSRQGGPAPVRRIDMVEHPLLGTRLRVPGLSGVVFQGVLEPGEPRYLGSYRIRTGHFAPLSVQVEMVRAGAQEGLRWARFSMKDVQVGDPFGLPKKDGRLTHLSYSAPRGGESTFRLQSMARSGSGTPRWITHLSGTVRRETGPAPQVTFASGTRERCHLPGDREALYGHLKKNGLRLGDYFTPIDSLWFGDGEALAGASLADNLAHETPRYGIHPALFEAAFQITSSFNQVEAPPSSGSLATSSIAGIEFHGDAGHPAWIHARVLREDADRLEADVDCFSEDGELVASLHGMVHRRAPASKVARRVIPEDEWSYGVYWHESREAPAGSGDLTGEWLVVGTGHDFEGRLGDALTAGGATVHRVVIGDDGEAPGDPAVLQVSRANPEWPSEVIDRILDQDTDRFRGVVSCVGLFEPRADEDGSIRQDRAVRIVGDTTELAATLGRRDVLTGPFLLLTSGSVEVTGFTGVHRLESAPLWGFLPILRSEYAGLRSRVFDMDARAEDRWVEAVLGELGTDGEEGRVAWRAGKRFVARLEPFRDTGPTRESVVRDDRAYLVTGGLGWVGRAIAEWLASKGAGLIALNARRAPDPETSQWIRALREAGTRVEVVLGDVADTAQVRAVFETVDAFDVPLGGIFHAAGVLRNQEIVDTTREVHRDLMASKVAGTWNLHLESLQRPVEMFVLFGTLASLMGRTLQAAYAAANAYLPAVAAHRVESGLPVTCLEWGLWGGGGMVGDVTDRALAAFRSTGITPLEPARAVTVLEDHLREQTRRVAIASIDWEVASEAATGVALEPFFDRLIEDAPADDQSILDSAADQLKALAELTSEERTERLVHLITEQMSGVLGIEPADLSPDLDVRLSGFDSLMALELRHRLETELGLTMPAPGAMGSMSPAKLGAQLAELVPAAAASQASDGEAEEAGWVSGEI